MEKFVSTGGTALRGEIPTNGSKNSALPALAAALLTDVQKPKLQALDAARKLQIPISQAQSLFLLEGSFYGLLAAESGIGKMPMLP